ncbi:MAG: Lpg1974 family pore-forming outer membrane protein [Simkaniaceae bacterium]|nr:Lpg1974 family pore-forming outer membrane protein [Candidatus Sacchlamyda saccharinae]
MLSKKSVFLLLGASSLFAEEECCFSYNPPARAFAPECCGFYLNVDPVIWQARVGGTGIAVQENGHSRVQNLNYDWDWGFRVGIGVNTSHDAWDVLLQWTHWSTDAKRDFSGSTNFPRFGHIEESANVVSSNWKLQYDLIDLEAAREFWISSCVSMRPFGGLRAAWIDQKEFDIDLEGLSSYSSYCIGQSDRYWGIGIRSGLDMQWGFGHGFSFFNDFAGNLLYSFHSVKHKEKGDGDLLFDVKNFFHIGSAIFDMQLGLRYDWISCDCCYHVGLDLGWELHWLPGQNQFLLFVDEEVPTKYVSNQGDLGIQGYFLKVRFDF